MCLSILDWIEVNSVVVTGQWHNSGIFRIKEMPEKKCYWPKHSHYARVYTICTIFSLLTVVFRCLRVVLFIVVTYDQFIQKSKQIHRVKKKKFSSVDCNGKHDTVWDNFILEKDFRGKKRSESKINCWLF